MDYNLRFKLDVKKNVYISKKAKSAEPYYQISAIITINNKRINYYTGFSAQTNVWVNTKSEDGKHNYGVRKGCYAKKGSRVVPYSNVNRALDKISAALLTLSSQTVEMTKETIVEALDSALGKVARRSKRQKVEDVSVEPEIIESPEPEEKEDEGNKFWVLAELYCMDAAVSEGRNKTRVNVVNHLRRFENYRGKELSFPDCNAKLLTDFNVFLDQDEGENDSTLHPRRRARKKNSRTVSKIMKCAKHFFKWCHKNYGVSEYGNITDYTAPPEIYGDPIVMTQEEKRKLWNTEFKDEGLEYTRDLFYFQCSIGCRISDYFRLTYENLVEEDGGLCIYYCPDKTVKATSIICRIPLTPNAINILNKYRIEDASPKTPLFHFPDYSQTYNRQLKRMFKAAGLNRRVVTYNSYDQIEIKPLHDIAISKFARSNFIDTMVGNGTTDNIIGTMSGHIAGSKAFHRYHNRQKSQQQNEAIKMLD
ncbi:MAG: phage integrase SAM-like domain-containing protein [Alistipes sp.]|nr:phage integrase SAM-like domain-containing protein [Alistipes sp.]